MIRPMTPMLQRAAYHCASTVRKRYPGKRGGRISILRPCEDPMLAQPRKIRLVARQAKATERELLAMRLQACDRPVRHWGNPPEPIARSAEPRPSCGALVRVWDSSGPP